MKKRITAALLAIFLGGAGIHKFYLGRIAWGIIYLLFCWTWIPSILGVIDFIILCCMSDEKFDQKYNTKKIESEPIVRENNPNYVEEVKRLYDLKEKGIITQEEFELKKKMLL